ncbi:MAG: diguanylate cyclase [Betaproteobacteria bacterium]
MAKILIVEGTSANRRAAVASLTNAGHVVIESSRGAVGLKLALSEKPDLILVDTLLPDMDGSRFVRALRATPNVDHPQVIFRAAPCIDAEARDLATHQTGFFVSKRPDAESLCAVVAEALATPKWDPGTPPPQPQSSEGLWQRLTRKLNLRTEQLERLIVDLEARFRKSEKQLKVARAAVDREIQKRLWAERELAHANLRLKDQALRDFATGLHNRRFLEASLRLEVSRARRAGRAFGVVLIDVDNLRQVNLASGHAAGDAVMFALGERLQSLVRGEDIVARYGGDQFALVMTQCPAQVVLARAETLCREVGGLAGGDKEQPLGAVALSVGIGTFPTHGNNGDEVLQAAGHALTLAKRSGGSRIVVGTSEIGAATSAPAGPDT